MRKNSNILPKTWNQINSYNYELYSIDYHQSLTNHQTWHWRNIPESILYDSGFVTDFNKLRLRRKDFFEEKNKYYNIIREYGLDGISFDGNVYHGIQSKLYNPKVYLTASDLGTFCNVISLRMRMKNPSSSGYLYHTGRLQLDLRDDIDNSQGQIIRHLLPYDENIQNDFFTKNPHLINQNKELESENEHELKECEYILRPYQKEAIQRLSEEWDNNKLLHLPPGTGKTVIFCNHAKEKAYKNIFIISPLKIHVKQNLNRMKEFLPDYETLLLDSDLNGSTEYKVLEEMLNKNSIISTTFDSAQNVLKNIFTEKYDYEENDLEEGDYDESNLEDDLDESDLEEADLDESNLEDDLDESDLEENDCDEDDLDENELEEDDKSMESKERFYKAKYDLSNSILIVDEAHNLINKDELIKIVKSFPKVLLVTATPPSCMEDIMNCEVIYQYPFRKAIEEKYICDYQIYLPLLTIDKSTKVSNVNIEKPIELKDLDTNLTQKCLYLINGMLQNGCRRCISYLSSQEECNLFTKVFEEVMKKYHYLPFWIKSIICDVSDNERKNILDEFQKNDKENGLKIICSIRILNEGVDIPKCDSIFISNVGTYSSDIIMVQRMCRANRLVKEEPNKVAHCFLWTTDLNKIVHSLSLLKENDIEFHKKIKFINTDYDKQNNEDHIKEIEKENNKLNEFIQVKCMSYEDIWEMKKNLLFEFCDINKRVPKYFEKYNEYNIGIWYYQQKNKIKSINDKIYKKLSINEFIKISIDIYLSIIDKWDIKKEILFQFCNKNKRVPTKKEKNINIRYWLNVQKKKINNIKDELYKKLCVNEYVKISLDNYLKNKEKNKDKKYFTWEEKKEILFEFCNINKTIPTRKKIYKNENIGLWLKNQKAKIKNTNDELYQKLSLNQIVKISLDNYLKNKEQNKNKQKLSWEESKKILFEFCNKNKKMPSYKENNNIIRWLQDQKKKINSIYNKLYQELSINEYVKISLDNYLKNKEQNKNKQKISWEESKKNLFEFCNKNKRIPKKKEEYKNQNIRQWFDCQKRKISSIENELYQILSINEYIKVSLDKYLINKK